MAHQLDGAAVLGLHEENKNMRSALATSSTPKHKSLPVWAVNSHKRTCLSIDYRNPSGVPFELVEKADEAYRWSGDPTCLSDSVLWNFCRRRAGSHAQSPS